MVKAEGAGATMSKIEQLTQELAEPIAKQIGCEVIEAEYKKEGSDYFLRVYLDREDGGVDLDACEYVSRRLEAELDRLDPIKDAYYLEVCSPGLDRPLKRDKDFERFLGSAVEVKFFAAHDGKKELEGTLAGYADGMVTVECGSETITFPKSEAAYVRLAVQF